MEENRLAFFSKAIRRMIAKSASNWNAVDDFYTTRTHLKEYTKEEIKRIIDSGDLNSQIRLSKNYFYKNGVYKQLIIYYANLLLYSGLLTPNPVYGTQLSNASIKKRYNSAVDYIDKINIPKLLANFSIHALVEGCYYGVIQNLSKTNFTILDLPSEYCRSNFKDAEGNDVLEFNITYFNTINSNETRDMALKAYPEIISSYWNRWNENKALSPWVIIPAGVGFCFPFLEDGRPIFLDILPSVLDYEESVEVEKERDLEEIRKIIVQKIPHLNDGTLVFEPDEAEVMHAGTVDMLSGNKNLSVMTTYADVDSVVSRAASEANSNNLEKMYQNIYANGATTSQIFAPIGSQAIPYALKRELSMMMILANKYSAFITYLINQLFSNSAVTFSYKILPISYFNQSDYITDTLKLADKGYSFLLPVLACGISQKEFVNLKHLENDVLGLGDIMIPLKSSYTESANSENGPGAPAKKLEDKAPKTIQNENAIDNQGGL